ncbi:MAG: GNAT family N-acetyltransferase [Anaerobacillus sp.]|uniref:GNAT family N-acetyltransferase n=1 Tax=Anaerobacillus sp. TaxID=1872506 RepID=UPI00391ACD13
MGIVIRIATEKDLLPIQHLLAKANLSERGIEDNIDNFLVVEDPDKKIIGTVGIEPIENDGLLRSLVMSSESWNAKIGLDFIELAVAYGKQKGYETLYLLTNSSMPFFEYIGFKILEENEIPEHLKLSEHFAQYVEGVTKVMALSTADI